MTRNIKSKNIVFLFIIALLKKFYCALYTYIFILSFCYNSYKI